MTRLFLLSSQTTNKHIQLGGKHTVSNGKQQILDTVFDTVHNIKHTVLYIAFIVYILDMIHYTILNTLYSI